VGGRRVGLKSFWPLIADSGQNVRSSAETQSSGVGNVCTTELFVSQGEESEGGMLARFTFTALDARYS
jgi:hypothetical protein